MILAAGTISLASLAIVREFMKMKDSCSESILIEDVNFLAYKLVLDPE